MRSSGTIGAVVCFALGCGGVEHTGTNKDDVVGSGGAPGSGGSGETPGFAGQAGSGSAEPCITYDHAMIHLDGSDGTVAGGTGIVRDVEFDAVALPIGDGDMDMNVCPDHDCSLQQVTRNVTISAPGLIWRIESGSLIHFHYTEGCAPAGCGRAVMITSPAAVGSEGNPHPAASGLYLAVSDGYVTREDAPYSVALTSSACKASPVPAADAGCPRSHPPEIFDLRFAGADGSNVTVLAMGQQAEFMLNHYPVYARNLRSYATGYCNDGLDSAYWVNGTLPPR